MAPCVFYYPSINRQHHQFPFPNFHSLHPTPFLSSPLLLTQKIAPFGSRSRHFQPCRAKYQPNHATSTTNSATISKLNTPFLPIYAPFRSNRATFWLQKNTPSFPVFTLARHLDSATPLSDIFPARTIFCVRFSTLPSSIDRDLAAMPR